MFIAKGRLAGHTFRYRVRRQRRPKRRIPPWANLMFKGDDGRWRKVKRYKTVNRAYGILLRLTGHKIDVEKIVAKLS